MVCTYMDMCTSIILTMSLNIKLRDDNGYWLTLVLSFMYILIVSQSILNCRMYVSDYHRDGVFLKVFY